MLGYPCLCDIDPNRFTRIRIKHWIVTPLTKAFIPVHLFGQVAIGPMGYASTITLNHEELHRRMGIV